MLNTESMHSVYYSKAHLLAHHDNTIETHVFMCLSYATFHHNPRVRGQVPVPLPNFKYNQLLNFSVDAYCA